MLRRSSMLLRTSPNPFSVNRQRLIHDGSKDESVRDRLSQLGVDPSFHNQVVQTLASVLGGRITVSTLDTFGADGIQALAKSLEHERLKTEPSRAKRDVIISIPHHRTEFQLSWRQGQSLMQLSQDDEVLKEYIEGPCGGTMACCTCHVYLDPDSYAALGGTPSENEQDMLDLAYDRRETSRLGCQVYLNEAMLRLDKVIVTIPDGVNNVW